VEAQAAVEALGQALNRAGFRLEHATVAGVGALVARKPEFRWTWFGTRLHTFVVVLDAPGATQAAAADLVAAAQQYAIENKGGLPRGLQTGTATIAVLLADDPPPDVREWFAAAPKHRYGALSVPVLAEPRTGSVTTFSGKRFVGSVYASHLRGVVDDVIAPALR
jgi:hypothetical protein